MISENGDSKLWLLLIASPLTCTGERNASLLVLAAVTPQSNALLHIVKVMGHCTAWTRLLWELNFLIWDSKILVWWENIPLPFQWHSEICQEVLIADGHSNFQHRKYHDTDWKSRDEKHKDHDGLCNLSLKWHLWTTSSWLNANQWSAGEAATSNNTYHCE